MGLASASLATGHLWTDEFNLSWNSTFKGLTLQSCLLIAIDDGGAEDKELVP